MSQENRPTKHAIVLSGGGADGAYGVGVLKALCSGRSHVTGYQPLTPDIVAGTSIGSFNAAFVASHWQSYGPATVSNLEQVWLDRLSQGPNGNGVFRVRGNPLHVFDPRRYFPNPLMPLQQLANDGATVGWDSIQRGVHFASAKDETVQQRLLELFSLTTFVDTTPMYETLEEVMDYRAIRNNPMAFRALATNWATGELHTFANRDMTNAFGPTAIAASAAIPGFFPPVEFGALPFVDGSVLSNTPIKPAIVAGADVLHVIYLDPKIENIPLAHIQNFPETYYRMQQIAWAKSVNDDIGDARRINRGLDWIERVRRGDSIRGDDSREFIEVARTIVDKLQESFGDEGPKRRPLTIYRYRPQDPLSGDLGLLNFDRDRLAALIERGYQDTVHHNIEACRDVFPNAEARQAAIDRQNRLPQNQDEPTSPADTTSTT